jgi:hypothetical protein
MAPELTVFGRTHSVTVHGACATPQGRRGARDTGRGFNMHYEGAKRKIVRTPTQGVVAAKRRVGRHKLGVAVCMQGVAAVAERVSSASRRVSRRAGNMATRRRRRADSNERRVTSPVIQCRSARESVAS